MNRSTRGVQSRQSTQKSRIERITRGLLGPKPHHITFVFSDDEISLRIDGSDGSILAEAYRGTPIAEVEKMNDQELENRLKKLLRSVEPGPLTS